MICPRPLATSTCRASIRNTFSAMVALFLLWTVLFVGLTFSAYVPQTVTNSVVARGLVVYSNYLSTNATNYIVITQRPYIAISYAPYRDINEGDNLPAITSLPFGVLNNKREYVYRYRTLQGGTQLVVARATAVVDTIEWSKESLASLTPNAAEAQLWYPLLMMYGQLAKYTPYASNVPGGLTPNVEGFGMGSPGSFNRSGWSNLAAMKKALRDNGDIWSFELACPVCQPFTNEVAFLMTTNANSIYPLGGWPICTNPVGHVCMRAGAPANEYLPEWVPKRASVGTNRIGTNWLDYTPARAIWDYTEDFGYDPEWITNWPVAFTGADWRTVEYGYAYALPVAQQLNYFPREGAWRNLVTNPVGDDLAIVFYEPEVFQDTFDFNWQLWCTFSLSPGSNLPAEVTTACPNIVPTNSGKKVKVYPSDGAAWESGTVGSCPSVTVFTAVNYLTNNPAYWGFQIDGFVFIVNPLYPTNR